MTASSPIALITGASTGIGASYADRLAARGYDLIINARDEAKLRERAVELADRHGSSVEILAADLGQAAGVEAVERRLARGDVALLVNNAGIAVAGQTIEMSPDEMEGMLRLNMISAARLAQAAAKAMVAKGRGDIINIASVASLTADRPGVSVAYSATKAFLLSFSEGLDMEVANKGVFVQAVLPGITVTPIWDKSGIDLAPLTDRAMPVDDMVDAALSGFDQREKVTIPALADAGLWEAFVEARRALHPHLSLREPARRYGVTPLATARVGVVDRGHAVATAGGVSVGGLIADLADGDA